MIPEMHPVVSSAIEMVGYDPTTLVLAVRFAGGAIHLYTGVPSHIYDDLLAAESKGFFVNKYIKPSYPSAPG